MGKPVTHEAVNAVKITAGEPFRILDGSRRTHVVQCRAELTNGRTYFVTVHRFYNLEDCHGSRISYAAEIFVNGRRIPDSALVAVRVAAIKAAKAAVLDHARAL